MRLINTQTLELKEFFNENIPSYSILSHCWGSEEITYQEWQAWRSDPGWKEHGWKASKKGYQKILNFCQLSRELYMVRKKSGEIIHRSKVPPSALGSFAEIEWAWVDTMCIDKTSSTELTEAINSMFAWYLKSAVCIAFLEDVADGQGGAQPNIRSSRWFTRGWTLQELIAPSHVEFYTVSWQQCANKSEDAALISSITSIPMDVLRRSKPVSEFPVATRFSWARARTTTRVEDIAYCLLGIFGIEMPLLYGEGIKAFRRLQEEIIKHGVDHSILTWRLPQDDPSTNYSALAETPRNFYHYEGFRILSDIEDILWSDSSVTHMLRQLWSPSTNARRLWGVTSRGLEATLPLLPCTCRGQGKFFLDALAPCRLAVLNLSSSTHVLAIHVDGYKRDGSICWRTRGDTISQIEIKRVRHKLKSKDEWVNLCKTVYLQLSPSPRSQAEPPMPESVSSSLSSLKKFLA